MSAFKNIPTNCVIPPQKKPTFVLMLLLWETGHWVGGAHHRYSSPSPLYPGSERAVIGWTWTVVYTLPQTESYFARLIWQKCCHFFYQSSHSSVSQIVKSYWHSLMKNVKDEVLYISTGCADTGTGTSVLTASVLCCVSSLEPLSCHIKTTISPKRFHKNAKNSFWTIDWISRETMNQRLPTCC